MLAWIRNARRFRHLDRAERRLLVEAALFTVTVRVALCGLSVGRVRQGLARIPQAARGGSGDTAERIARAVTRAAAGMPGATCLARALVLQALLARRGHRAHLCLGFVRSDGGALAGHAWVESGDRVFDDAGEASCYAPARAVAGS